MTRPRLPATVLTTGNWYRILTRNGRQWDRVRFDAARLGFTVSAGRRGGEPKLVSLDCVERIMALSTAADWHDVGAWYVQEMAA